MDLLALSNAETVAWIALAISIISILLVVLWRR